MGGEHEEDYLQSLIRDVRNSLYVDPGRSDKEQEIIALSEVS